LQRKRELFNTCGIGAGLDVGSIPTSRSNRKNMCPIYDYECQECKHALAKTQKITAKATTICPKCGKHKLLRIISSNTALVFNGTGFYSTDYKVKR
jgi:putative FmdB family regulatory protein